MKRFAAIAGIAALLPVGLLGASALAVGESSDTVTACATASTPAHVVGVDGSDVHTIPGDVATQCEVKTYTIPTVTSNGTVTVTVTQPTTTATTATTTTGTTTTSPPPLANYAVSASGSDSNPCTLAAPCLSFARAANVVPSGSIIEVSGSLGNQQFAGGAGGTQGNISKTLTFVGKAGNKVKTITFGSGNFTFDGIDVDAGAAQSPAQAPLENGGAPFTFKNGSVGNVRGKTGAILDGPGIVLDNVRFHDVVQTGTSHVECIQAYAVPSFTLKNSRFDNCGIMGLSLGYPGWWVPKPPAYYNVVIEGNTFNAPVPSNNYALAIWSNKDSCNDTCGWGVMTGYRIKNNYIYSLINRMTTDSTTIICGNTGPGAPADWRNPCS